MRHPGILLLLALAASAEEPRFRDAAAERGLGGIETYRVTLVDLDGDGWADALLQDRAKGHKINPGGPLRLFRNEKGRFVERKEALPARGAGAIREGAPLTGVFAIAGDVDNDGTIDLFRGTYNEPADHAESPDTGERNAILLGPKWAARAAGGDGPATTCAACFVDYDRDGNLDLFVGNWYVKFGSGLMAHPDRLYRGDGKGGFEDVTAKAGLTTQATVGKADSHRPTYGVSHADVDGDGWEDILTSTYGRQWNRLWRNNRDGTFTDVAPKTGFDGDEVRDGKYPEWTKQEAQLKDRTDEPEYRANGNSFSAVPADVDNDGDADLFCCEINHNWAGLSSDMSALLVNEGDRFRRLTKPFERIDRNRKWTNQGDYVAAWADFDNDGRLDLLLGSGSYPDDQRLRIYRQKAELEFDDVTAAWGLDFRDVQHLGVDDVDGDGAVDILVTGQVNEWNGRKSPPLALFMNTPAPGNDWVEIVLVGAPGKSNRSAIGARVEVKAGGTTMVRCVQSATGHFGLAPSRTLHFGLGPSSSEKFLVTVRWPDAEGTRELWSDSPRNRRLRLVQGEGTRLGK